MKWPGAACAFFVQAALLILLTTTGVGAEPTIPLADGWRIQAASEVSQPGEIVSTTGFQPTGWYGASVPSTVLAALVSDGFYKDLYRGRNLEQVPRERFRQPWWYRREFSLPRGASPACVRLQFDGINYRADIWLNGRRIAAADTAFGAFRRFDVDVTGTVRPQGNVLAVEVLPPQKGDYTLGFADWNPAAPDLDMGLFRPVTLRLSGPVSIERPRVDTRIEGTSAKVAVSATVANHADREMRGVLIGHIDDLHFRQPYTVPPHAEREVVFPPLVIAHPRLWWPAELGTPELYTLALETSGDRVTQRFGIREVGEYVTSEGYRGYTINGRKILIKGGGWADDMLLREDRARLETQLRYVRHMHLNTIRLEGFWGSSQTLYDLADEMGVFVMVGWSCQWEWEDYLGAPQTDTTYGAAHAPTDQALLAHCLRDQVRWLRHHPSILTWVVGSDKLPWPEQEKRYRDDLAVLDPGRPILSSCQSWRSTVSGPTAVKMNGPYDYVPPDYWYIDTTHGGAFGFNTETGPGPLPPPAESLRAMLGEVSRWPIDETWNFHCARNEFRTLDYWRGVFERRYGAAATLDEFAQRAQVSNYEAIRAMYEAFAVHRAHTTGIIQWMLNSAWPKLYWQLYDYSLVPGGAFYGTRKGCQPLSVVYDYGEHAIYVVNQSGAPLHHARVRGMLLDAASRPICRIDAVLATPLAADASARLCKLPPLATSSPLYFLALELDDSVGKKIADNFYWLSSRPDVLDEAKSTWYVTPLQQAGDLTALNRLPPADVEVHARREGDSAVVTLHNRSAHVAFFIELRICAPGTDRSQIGVLWDDDYISLQPGETRTLRARGVAPRTVVRWQGMNTARGVIGL